MATYAATEELRHCLLHRAVFTDTSGALIWHDKQGAPGRPVTREEQDAFVRAALRAAQLVIPPSPDERIEDDLMHQLGLLAGVHGVALGQVPQHLRLARITAIIGADPATPGSYKLDVPALKSQSPWPDAAWADLFVQLNDRPGQELRGRLEHAPDAVVATDPAAPPSWLS
jgi:hypothetical protein